ncbi:hypothetical protein V2S66_31485 [Streptomyces sp. V4-01]|uniref:Uncharacterized protein n=1 Tax=Actinacidiphila polyblastidii TaxID=3110430 RepID=A0ABU7PL15_9ACTN|nr:hypothetical protein [Streptomyces sp. V4-01]
MTRTYGYQPTSNATPGTPPNEPAGASSAQPRRHRLAVHATGYGQGSTVTLDGHDISGALTGLTFAIEVNKPTTATLDLRLYDVTEIQDVEARVLVPDGTRDALIALGWAPPAEPTEVPTADLDVTEFLVVHRYRRDQGGHAWLFRCWGDGGCDGFLSLDWSTRASAERQAREHLAGHPATAPTKTSEGSDHLD